MAAFDYTWARIARSVRAGDRLSGWSRDKGETSLRFVIREIDSTSITVTPSGKQSRRISKGDFSKVYEVWPDYLRRKMGRAEVAAISQNTSYIFSIFHSLEK
jgi:hypothetical protein